jgi:RNA polymerase sigma factor (sigma-70 family)
MSHADAEARLDAALVARVVANDDRAAFTHLLRRHQGLVRAQLRRLCKGDHGWADDLAQECFLQAWRKIDQFRNEARFSTWLYRIAYTCFLQAQRGRAPDEVAAAGAPQFEGATESDPALALDLARALGQLAEGERDALIHCYHLDLSHEEAASVLGMPVGTVKSHIKRGKDKLKQLLGAWGGTGGQGALE